MFLPTYTNDELAFSYRCYVYFRWHTFRNRRLPTLQHLTAAQLQAVHPEIHLLELNASETEIALMASIRPTDSISTAASKLKGSASKILRQTIDDSTHDEKLLGGGYFAATVGVNTTDELNRYLDRQGNHHGYDERANPPVWVQTWPLSEADNAALQTPHAKTILRWHVALSTWNRQGVFSWDAAQAVCTCWARQGADWQVRIHKASFLPDHIHVAVWSHPTVKPAELVVSLMNSSQELMLKDFDGLLIRAGIPRLWKPGAYVGSYGDISRGWVRNYLRQWSVAD